MTDTHSHIYGSEFQEDRAEVIQRAKEAGVQRILLPNINAESIAPMLQLCEQYLGYCYPMMGLHPEDVREDWVVVLDAMQRLLEEESNPYVAVGEVGLDFYWDTTYREQQMEVFARQIQWALDYRMPLVIHTRAAHREVVDVLSAFSKDCLTGVFHCFGGTLQEAEELLGKFPGFCLGIGGVLTYKKSILPEVVRQVPLERIVLETDAPYLSPVPYRGRRNESAYVMATAQRLAQERNVSVDEVQRVTEANVQRLFPKVFA